MMRNGVLGAMGEILIRVLSKDDLDDKMKSDRDNFLEKLEVRKYHCFIYHTVRCKSVRSWCDGSSDRSFREWTH